MTPLLAGLGTTELLIIFGVIILLFGAAKLPELARGSGRALRIFKAETKGLMDDDDEPDAKPARTTAINPATPVTPTSPVAPVTPVEHPADVAPAETDPSRRGETA